MLCGRGVEPDIKLDAPARRHHDRVYARFRLRSPELVGERHAIETHNLNRDAPSDAGPVDVSEAHADVCVRRGIDETPELFSAGNNADVGDTAGRGARVADGGPVDALAERALGQSGSELGGC